MPVNDLAGKTVLVTGGSRGLGRAIVLAFAQSGCNIAVNYVSNKVMAEATCEAARGFGVKAIAFQADVSNSDQVAAMMVQISEQLADIAILVNNAGIAEPAGAGSVPLPLWSRTIAINLTSAFLVTEACLPQMLAQGWGRIINIASVAALNGGMVGPHYAASKAGMLGLTRSYAKSLANQGITSNAVNPAFVMSDMLANRPEIKADHIPIGRFGGSNEVADVVMMLARTGYLTGQSINVNGGLYFG
jgi:3-oxoacyl-[acyl-carrier protein] reductase